MTTDPVQARLEELEKLAGELRRLANPYANIGHALTLQASADALGEVRTLLSYGHSAECERKTAEEPAKMIVSLQEQLAAAEQDVLHQLATARGWTGPHKPYSTVAEASAFFDDLMDEKVTAWRQELAAAQERVGKLEQTLVSAAFPLEVLNADNYNGAKWMTDEVRGAVEVAVSAIRAAIAAPQREERTRTERGNHE